MNSTLPAIARSRLGRLFFFNCLLCGVASNALSGPVKNETLEGVSVSTLSLAGYSWVSGPMQGERARCAELYHRAIINGDWKAAESFLSPAVLPLSEDNRNRLHWMWKIVANQGIVSAHESSDMSAAINGERGAMIVTIYDPRTKSASGALPLPSLVFWQVIDNKWRLIPSILGEISITTKQSKPRSEPNK